MSFNYIKQRYGVPAEYGREVTVEWKGNGFIVGADGGYLLITLHSEKQTIINNYHPTSGITYLGMGKPRKLTASQKRYKRYLDADSGLSFKEWLKTESVALEWN